LLKERQFSSLFIQPVYERILLGTRFHSTLFSQPE